jgi:hypothetical protein
MLDMLKPGQFPLRALFGATAFVAAAAALVQAIRTTSDPLGQFWCALLVPVLICGAVGTLRGRVRPWLGFGVMFDIGLTLLALTYVAVYA